MSAYIYPVSENLLEVSTIERIRDIASRNDISLEPVDYSDEVTWGIEIPSDHDVLSSCNFDTRRTKSASMNTEDTGEVCAEHSETGDQQKLAIHRYTLNTTGGVVWGLIQHGSNSTCFAHTLVKVLFECEDTVSDSDTLDRKYEVGLIRSVKQIDYFSFLRD